MLNRMDMCVYKYKGQCLLVRTNEALSYLVRKLCLQVQMNVSTEETLTSRAKVQRGAHSQTTFLTLINNLQIQDIEECGLRD